jgi:Holliday junction resolvase
MKQRNISTELDDIVYHIKNAPWWKEAPRMNDPGPGQPLTPQASSLGRTAKPFVATDAAHAVVRAAEQVGWDISDIQKFLRQVQHVEYGLSSEMEFAAILRWLGWCSFVHRLSEDMLEDPARSLWAVPDLFVVFSADNQICTALIEVKTSDGTLLKFKKSYLQRLQAYAELMKQPLLIAWRPRPLGFWILFDPRIAQRTDNESLEVDFGLALKNDLMSMLAGDYYITPKRGRGTPS